MADHIDEHDHTHDEEEDFDILSFGFEMEPDIDDHEHEHIDAQVLLLEDPETGEQMDIALIDQIEDENGQIYWICMELVPGEDEEEYHYGETIILRVDRDLGGEYEVSMVGGMEYAHVQELWDRFLKEEEEKHNHDLEDSGDRD